MCAILNEVDRHRRQRYMGPGLCQKTLIFVGSVTPKDHDTLYPGEYLGIPALRDAC